MTKPFKGTIKIDDRDSWRSTRRTCQPPRPGGKEDSRCVRTM